VDTAEIGESRRIDRVKMLGLTLHPLCLQNDTDVGIYSFDVKRLKGSPYSNTERRVPELIPVLGSRHAGDVSHNPDGRLPLLSARPAVTPATLKRAATNFAAWRTDAQ